MKHISCFNETFRIRCVKTYQAWKFGSNPYFHCWNTEVSLGDCCYRCILYVRCPNTLIACQMSAVETTAKSNVTQQCCPTMSTVNIGHQHWFVCRAGLKRSCACKWRVAHLLVCESRDQQESPPRRMHYEAPVRLHLLTYLIFSFPSAPLRTTAVLCPPAAILNSQRCNSQARVKSFKQSLIRCR